MPNMLSVLTSTLGWCRVNQGDLSVAGSRHCILELLAFVLGAFESEL